MAVEPCERAQLGLSGSPNSHLNGRTMPLPMGKVLGGGSSISGAWQFRRACR